MPKDDEFHALATKFPEAALAALGIVARHDDYRACAVELKRSAKRLDLVFLPRRRALPIIIAELLRRHDREAEQAAVEKAIQFCREWRDADAFARTIVAMIYARPALARAVWPADIGPPAERSLRFTPLRIVLTDLDPEPLLRRGGSARILLPLVGPEATVRANAPSWKAALEADAAFTSDERRAAALELFLDFLTERLGRIDARTLFGEEGAVSWENTATGRAMQREFRCEQMREDTIKVLRARFGRVPRRIKAELEAIDDPRRLRRIFDRALKVASLDDLRLTRPARG